MWRDFPAIAGQAVQHGFMLGPPQADYTKPYLLGTGDLFFCQ